jgi:hypothetical protein
MEIDLSRYCIGKGREEQVELLSEDESPDFYSQEDYEELEKIENWIRTLCEQFILLANYHYLLLTFHFNLQL